MFFCYYFFTTIIFLLLLFYHQLVIMGDPDDVINLHQLENLPDPALMNVLTRLDSKSLVNVCSQSRRIRDFCQYAWRDLFKRDITTKKVCSNSNWEKLYRLATTLDFPVYALSYGSNEYIIDEHFDDELGEIPNAVAIGKASLMDEIKTALKDELRYSKKDIAKFFRKQNLDVKIDRVKIITLVDPLYDYEDDEDGEGGYFFIGFKLLGYMSAQEIMKADVDTADDIYIVSVEDENVFKAILGLDNLEKEVEIILKDNYLFTKNEVKKYLDKNKKNIQELRKGGKGPYGEELGDYTSLESGGHGPLIVIDIRRLKSRFDTDISTLKKYICSL